MADEASCALMIWDGESLGTIANIARLINQRKNVVVYDASKGNLSTLRCMLDWEEFISGCGKELQHRIRQRVGVHESHSGPSVEMCLF